MANGPTLYALGDSQTASSTVDQGLTWAERLAADHFGGRFQEVALGGSKVLDRVSEPERDLTSQVDAVLASGPGSDDVATVMIGGGDFRGILSMSPDEREARLAQVIDKAVEQIERLVGEGGVGRVIWVDNPNGYIPGSDDLGPEDKEILRGTFEALNEGVRAGLAHNDNVWHFDMDDVFADVIADPEGYGLAGYGPGDGATHFFADPIHPGRAAQPIMAEAISAEYERLVRLEGTKVAMSGTEEADNVEGSVSNDRINGGQGDDSLGGWQGSDTLTGQGGHDVLRGHSAQDILGGGGGRDVLEGGAGDDTLSGGSGRDILAGGSGADALGGGFGYDVALYTHSAAGVAVDLASGTGSGGDAAGDRLTSIEGLFGSHHNDRLTGDAGRNLLHGLSGNDVIIGGAGNDTLIGGTGADRLFGQGGLDMAHYRGSTEGVIVDLDAGRGFGGEAQGDTLAGIDGVEGSDHGDSLTGTHRSSDTASGADRLFGHGGEDTLRGRSGDDTLHGGAGDDSIYGDGGSDILTGGAGADAFHFRPHEGRDVVRDFEQGVDTLVFHQPDDGLGADGILAASREAGGDTFIEIADSVIVLKGVTGLSADDILVI